MGGGKSSGNQSTQAQLTPEQIQTINLQNQFLQSYLPTLTQAATGAGNVYNQVQGNTAGQAGATQNVANIAGSQQLGTGSQALNSGVSGLESLFSPQYEQQQVQGALAPSEFAAQQANVGMNAGFAGAGEQGSSREALANQTSQALQQQMLGSTAANVESGITAGRASAANSLGQIGTTNLGSATGTVGQGLSASAAPVSLYNQYASTIFGAPQQTPNYSGTQGQTQSGSGKNSGINFSDIRLKRFVHVLDYGLAEVKKLIPVSWLWKDIQAHGDRKEIGFIAQDVEALIPEVVSKKDGYLGIDYPRLTAVLVNAIKQQQAQIDDLARKVEELKHELPA